MYFFLLWARVLDSKPGLFLKQIFHPFQAQRNPKTSFSQEQAHHEDKVVSPHMMGKI